MKITINYEPHEKQVPFHDSTAKYRLLCTGAGFGKTAAGVVELLKECLKSRPGTWWAMAAPTYKVLTNVTIREFMKFCPRELIKNYNRSEQIITLVNDVSIIGVAGDRDDTIDRVRGLTLGGAYGDEIATSSEYMHEILVARIRDPGGSLRMWYTTTPRGRNWLKRIFEDKKMKDGHPIRDPQNYEMFKGSTLDNPHTPKEYKESMLNTYVGVFKKQEIYGEFVGFEGLVYMEFSRNVHVIDTKGMEFVGIIAGVDFGFTNPSVILKAGLDHDGRLYIIDEFYETHVTDSHLADWAKENMSDAEVFIADSENPSGIQEFDERELNCRGVKKVQGERQENFVVSGIKKVSASLKVRDDGKPRLFVDKRCVNTIMEFENYRYREQKVDQPEGETPLKIHDHAMDVIRYMMVTLGEVEDKTIMLEGENG